MRTRWVVVRRASHIPTKSKYLIDQGILFPHRFTFNPLCLLITTRSIIIAGLHRPKYSSASTNDFSRNNRPTHYVQEIPNDSKKFPWWEIVIRIIFTNEVGNLFTTEIILFSLLSSFLIDLNIFSNDFQLLTQPLNHSCSTQTQSPRSDQREMSLELWSRGSFVLAGNHRGWVSDPRFSVSIGKFIFFR